MTRATGNSRFENAKFPPPAKEKIPENSRSVKCLILHAHNTMSTQTSNIYLNQLQWYGQFAEVHGLHMLHEVLGLDSWYLVYPNVTDNFPSVPDVETVRHRSITVVSINAPHPRPDKRPPDTASPRTSSLEEHLPSQADECKQNLDLGPIRIISASSFV